MESEQTLGRRLREARLAASLSQTDLSERSGIPKPTLSRYENDHVSPSLHTLARLAEALNVHESSLLGNTSSLEDVFIQALHDEGVTFATADDAIAVAGLVVDELRKRRAAEAV